MTKKPLAAACAAALIVLAGGIAAPDEAYAAVYRGVFDPVYTNMDTGYTYTWSGTQIFDISDACLSGSSLATTTAVGSYGCTATMGIGTLNVAADYFGTNYTDSVTFDLSGLTGYGDPYVQSIVSQNDQLLGVNTSLFPLISVYFPYHSENHSDPANFFSGQTWALYWQYDDQVVGTYTPNSVNPNGGAIITTNPVPFSVVPEPGSLGLALTALAGGWLARRRRARAT